MTSSLLRRTILIPVDFSEQSIQAIDVALELSEPDANLHVLHVLAELQVADPGVVWQEIDNDNRAQHALTALQERLSDEKYQQLRLEIRFGDPGHCISEFAEQVGADLIVLPSHGRSGIARWLMGSVAERVVRLAHCPVLVLRGPPPETAT